VKIRNRKVANASPKEKPKANPKKVSKGVPKFDIKASRVW
jgi:hypothetical protein